MYLAASAAAILEVGDIDDLVGIVGLALAATPSLIIVHAR